MAVVEVDDASREERIPASRVDRLLLPRPGWWKKLDRNTKIAAVGVALTAAGVVVALAVGLIPIFHSDHIVVSLPKSSPPPVTVTVAIDHSQPRSWLRAGFYVADLGRSHKTVKAPWVTVVAPKFGDRFQYVLSLGDSGQEPTGPLEMQLRTRADNLGRTRVFVVVK
jgi:hypothetical protein